MDFDTTPYRRQCELLVLDAFEQRLRRRRVGNVAVADGQIVAFARPRRKIVLSNVRIVVRRSRKALDELFRLRFVERGVLRRKPSFARRVERVVCIQALIENIDLSEQVARRRELAYLQPSPRVCVSR